MNNQQLNEKLAKWIPLIDATFDAGGITYRGTIGDAEFPNLFVDYFTDSLDSCFLLLVPKLDYFCLTSEDKGGFYADVSIGEKYAEYFRAETPTLALCLALEKLIEVME